MQTNRTRGPSRFDDSSTIPHSLHPRFHPRIVCRDAAMFQRADHAHASGVGVRAPKSEPRRIGWIFGSGLGAARLHLMASRDSRLDSLGVSTLDAPEVSATLPASAPMLTPPVHRFR